MKLIFKILICVVSVVLCLSFMVSCSNTVISANKVSLGKIEMNVDGREVSLSSPQNRDALVNFGSEVLQNLYDSKNTLISPLSIYLALAMLANSAAGDTLTEMLSVMGLSIETLNEYCGHLYGLYVENDTNNEVVKIANSIWYNKENTDFVPKTEFLDTNSLYYGAEIYNTVFDDNAVKDINNWVKENTNNMINKILDNLNPLTIMILINALVFEDKWCSEFYNTVSGDFTDFNGNITSADYLRKTLSNYYDNGNAKAFCYKFENARFGFLGILPNQDIGSYMANFDGEELISLLNNNIEADVNAKLPCFTYDYGSSLNNTLSDMGMPSIFNDADFTAGWEAGGEDLYVSNVMHKTFIEVTKSGVRAAAVTAIIMEATSAPTIPPITIALDRPFVYAIMDMTYQVPLFIGVTGNL